MPSTDPSYRSSNLNKYTTGFAPYRWHIRKFQEFIAVAIRETEPESLLDAGCGEGHLTAVLKSAMPTVEVTGIDASEDAVRYASLTFPDAGQFSAASIFDLPFEANSFDVVLCSEVLEHLDDPAAALLELKRVARRFVFLTVPLEPYFKWLNDAARALGISPDPGHVQLWTRRSFATFVRQHLPNSTFSTKHYYQAAMCSV